MIKWTLETGMEQNADRQKMCNARLRHLPLKEYDIWRAVQRPAESLLAVAYTSLSLMSHKKHKELSRHLWKIISYGERYTSSQNPPDLSEREIRLIQTEFRRALGVLVLSGESDGHWCPPRATICNLYFAARTDAIASFQDFRPNYLEPVYAGGHVLLDAVSRLRHCALCGKLFFKVKRKLYCSKSHKTVISGRSRGDKGDKHLKARGRKFSGTETPRGRPRLNYHKTIEAEHARWLALIQPTPRGAFTGRVTRR